MLSRQARERQETADNGQGSEPLGAHPDPLQKEEELEVGRRSSRTEGRARVCEPIGLDQAVRRT